MEQDLQEQINTLRQQFEDLSQQFHTNNFSAHQDFNKASTFTTRLRVPRYDALPPVCERGEVIESGGTLYICSSADTWSVVGTQT